MTCRELTQLIIDHVTGRLPFAKQLGLRVHLIMCRRCRAHVTKMREAFLASGKVPDEPIPDDVCNHLASYVDESMR